MPNREERRAARMARKNKPKMRYVWRMTEGGKRLFTEPREPVATAEPEAEPDTSADTGPLENMAYGDLQAMAKDRGIPANQSREALVEALSDE